MLNREQKNEGWICPKCGIVNAPWKATCDCNSYQYVPNPYPTWLGKYPTYSSDYVFTIN